MIKFRLATWRDLLYVRRVRNEITARQWFSNASRVSFLQHWTWWVKRHGRPERLLVIVSSGRRVGYLRLNLASDGFTIISIALEPGARGKGLGSESIRSVIRTNPFAGSVGWRATVQSANTASIASFASAGFKPAPPEPGQGTHVHMELRRDWPSPSWA